MTAVDDGTFPVYIDGALSGADLPNECLRVCGHLARLGKGTGVARGHTVAMAQACRLGQRQVQEALALAEDHGLIERNEAAEDGDERVYHLTGLYGRLRVDPEVDDLRLDPPTFGLYLDLVRDAQEGDQEEGEAA